MLRYLRRNRHLMIGAGLIVLLLLFAGIGRLVWDTSQAMPLSGSPNRQPSIEHPLGTDRQGRDLLAVMIVATPQTLYIGLLAGIIGVALGTALAWTGCSDDDDPPAVGPFPQPRDAGTHLPTDGGTDAGTDAGTELTTFVRDLIEDQTSETGAPVETEAVNLIDTEPANAFPDAFFQ